MKEEETRLTDRDIYMKEELEHLWKEEETTCRRNKMKRQTHLCERRRGASA